MSTTPDPADLARTTVEQIAPFYAKYKTMIDLTIRTNPSQIRKVVTRERLMDALNSGAPEGTDPAIIEQVCNFGLAHFNRTVNALLIGCRSGNSDRLADVYAEALGVEVD